jgi:hypothetical protein
LPARLKNDCGFSMLSEGVGLCAGLDMLEDILGVEVASDADPIGVIICPVDFASLCPCSNELLSSAASAGSVTNPGTTAGLSGAPWAGTSGLDRCSAFPFGRKLARCALLSRSVEGPRTTCRPCITGAPVLLTSELDRMANKGAASVASETARTFASGLDPVAPEKRETSALFGGTVEVSIVEQISAELEALLAGRLASMMPDRHAMLGA